MKIRKLDNLMTPVSPKSLEEWEQTRREILAQLRFASSIDLLRNDAPLALQIFDPAVYDGFTVEKVIFQILPGLFGTGNLYRPANRAVRHPAILNPHGHWEHGRLETKPLAAVPQRCANQALRGMVAFSYDMIGYNDSTQLPHDGTLPDEEAWNVGRFSLQLLQSMRAADVVASLPDVDDQRIGCTGCSGGGTQTYFLAALDPRIQVAAPINMASVIMQGGCKCENTAFLRAEFCNVDYVMTIAPRPLFLSASDGDWTVHSREVEFPAVARVYSLYGAEDNFEHFYQSAPHCYNQPTRERVYDFFCRRFGLENPQYDEYEVRLDPDSLRIGGVASRVPRGERLEGDAEVMNAVRGILQANLTDAARQDAARRAFFLNRNEPLSIPYAVSGETVTLGRCPEPADRRGVSFYSAYNPSEDALRVGGLIRLLREYPNRTFEACGKSAALLEIAARYAENPKLALRDVDRSQMDIPGFLLT